MRFVLRTALPALLFITTGTLHFLRPALYLSIVPPGFGHAGTLVAISGAAELAGGIGLSIVRKRSWTNFLAAMETIYNGSHAMPFYLPSQSLRGRI